MIPKRTALPTLPTATRGRCSWIWCLARSSCKAHMRPQPFRQLTVLELANVLAGPSVGQFFAELGATVIKVENTRKHGDVTRRWRLPSEGTEGTVSSYFACCNWGKQSIALDLRTTEGRQLVQDLAVQSDIVLASYKPGDAEKLGVDAETLQSLNPCLIYGHITGYGSDDPRAGYDAVIQAESGFMYMNGSPDGPPLKMPVALMDILAAHQLKEGLLLALLERSTTGQGSYVAVSLIQAAVSALANQATNWLVAGHIPQRMGAAHPNIAPYGTTYACLNDELIVLAIGTDMQFQRLCVLLEMPNLAHDERFRSNTNRVRHREMLDGVLRDKIGRWDRDVFLRTLHEHKIPAGAVRTMPEVFDQPEAHAMVLNHAATGYKGLRQAAFGQKSAQLSAPPAYAENTRAVLTERLGLSSEEIEGLIQCGAVATRNPEARAF